MLHLIKDKTKKNYMIMDWIKISVTKTVLKCVGLSNVFRRMYYKR